MEMVKMCWKCNEEKKIDDFYSDKTKKDGIARPCRVCKLKQAKDYFAQNNNGLLILKRD
jgi:hypothetical protein